MYGFPLSISYCVEVSNIPNKFVKYIDVPLFKAVTLVLYGPTIKWEKRCQSKKWSLMQVLWCQMRIIVSENLELRDNCQK